MHFPLFNRSISSADFIFKKGGSGQCFLCLRNGGRKEQVLHLLVDIWMVLEGHLFVSLLYRARVGLLGNIKQLIEGLLCLADCTRSLQLLLLLSWQEHPEGMEMCTANLRGPERSVSARLVSSETVQSERNKQSCSKVQLQTHSRALTIKAKN